MRDLGSVVIGDGGPGLTLNDVELDRETSSAEGPRGSSRKLLGDAEKMLRDANFIVGDYISCNILPPNADGSVAAAPLPLAIAGTGNGGFGGDRFGRGRENGFGRERGGGGFRGRGGMRGDFGAGVPAGEWRRGEAVPEGPSGGWGRGRGRGDGFGGRDFGRGRGRDRDRW
jgi:histone deacetylase complex subunit SAP18